ncbi:MAG: hypothetical protein K0R51_2300 [Cytophagaceae bacterium]|jgi:hypothetical protein|nr:hypothetical protein [Cytophagaceae bacterium]
MINKLFLVVFFLCGHTVSLIAQSTSRTYIKKEGVNGETHSIYIENDRTSTYYNKILDFGFGGFDQASYDNSLEYLKEKNIVLSKTHIIDLPTEWITLKQYKDKFYVYHPCDFLFHYKVSINDTTFIDWTGEGTNGSKIISYNKINDQAMELKLTGIYEPSRTLIIHWIDRINGIAVFENTVNNDYNLMIDASKIKKVPIIINYCPTQKEMELEFDTPDYKKLLKRN